MAMSAPFEALEATSHEVRLSSALRILQEKREPVATRQRALVWRVLHSPGTTFDREGASLDSTSDATAALVASRLAVQVSKSMKARPSEVERAVRRLHWTE